MPSNHLTEYPRLLLRNSGLLFVSAIFKVIHSPLKFTLAIGGIAQIITSVTINIFTTKLNGKYIRIKAYIIKINKDYPHLVLVLSISMLAARFIFIYASFALGTILGIYSAFMNNIDYCNFKLRTPPVKINNNSVMHRLQK